MKPLKSVNRLIVHHSASPRDTTKLEDIRRWHKDRGFEDIGYHFVITGDGRIQNGRPITFEGAHCLGANHDSWGVCITGNNTVTGERWNHDQEDAVLDLILSVQRILPEIEVCGHRDAHGGETRTECPGLDFQSWLKGVI